MVPMNRLLRKKSFFSVLATVAAVSLAACGGGGSHSSTLMPSAPVSSTAPEYTGPLADATFRITIPVPTTSAKARRPDYVSSSTTKIVFTLNSATIAGMSGATLTAFNTANLGAKAVTLNSATCPGTGPWTCTLKIKLPPGTDNVTISAQDGSSNILSQQVQNFVVVVATANSFSTTLDANANTMTIGTTSGFCSGSFNVSPGGTVPTVGTATLTFNASYTDLAGKTIIAPGRPILSVNGHTDDNGGLGYTIVGTGGNANVKVNQSTQSYTLQATTSTTSATINVAATPANTNGSPTDGLVFNKTLTYTFQSGPAPPASLLAVIEQTGAAAGKIDLFTLSLGASDTFTAASPSTLASTNPGAGPDVDFPQDLLFDPNADILIANGGAGNPDFGNFACVPAGAITTGANVATVLTNNMNDPAFIELGTDSSVALGNVPAASGTKTPTFVLSGTYTAAPASRTITNTDYPGLGVTGLVAVPTSGTHPAGSYAVTITNGTTTSHVVEIGRAHV